MSTDKKIMDNLRMYLETMIEQNIYYSAIYKDYGSPSHSGYIRCVDKLIPPFRRCLQQEYPIGRVGEWINRLENNLPQPKTKEDYEEYEAYTDKLNRIKEDILEILNE